MSTYNALKYNVPFTNAGGLVLLSTQTASASASISFTSGLTSTYKEYLFIFNDIHPSNNDSYFQFNLSTDGGSNYNVTKTTTAFKSAHPEDNSGTYFTYETGHDLAQSTAYQRISIAISNNADASCAGTLNLFNPSSTTYVKHFIANTHNEQGGGFATNNFFAGYGNTTSAVNAIDFQISTGTFNGTIQMFGVVS